MSAVARVRAAYQRIEDVARPEVWVTLRPVDDALADAAGVDARVAAGEDLPLAGLTVAVKDNVDVAGLPTTAACPGFATLARSTAPAVERLVRAGAVVLGKTNLDQFATGLVGTRSPYGAVRHATDPERVSGGSSSGSAVAVALGIADIGIGTDTAGSGRVPAAFHGLVGLKTTVGLVPTVGVVPACRSYDVVTTLTRDLPTGVAATRLMAGPAARPWPGEVRHALPARPTVGVPRAEDLTPLCSAYREAFARAVDQLAGAGAEVREVDVSPLLRAATLLYDGALVAERYEAVGAFLSGAGPGTGVDPVVSRIILGGRGTAAHRYVADRARLADYRRHADEVFTEVDVLVLPTTTEHPTLAQVRDQPVAVNRRLGTYTNFVNLLDLAGVAVPAGAADGLPFGVTVLADTHADQLAVDLAARMLAAAPAPAAPVAPPAGTTVSATAVGGVDATHLVDGGHRLVVVGAHLRGQPLNGELERCGARFVREVRTSDAYRLLVLGTEPVKPGLVRAGPGEGAPITGEEWVVSPGALGVFLAGLPAPMSLGAVELEDGTWVTGFGCSAEAAAAGKDITEHGGWVAYLAATT
ncbi:allophanate hydrolase [Cellulomonas bogoriensis]|uniref:Allophanate hydrolase n=1 Tax=Cellulomonas bogoriensis 69B4 = DSM 16987 TaxID=1386082 RepID=A0A0A0C1J2_9CELL|nr:allophanate hydrolase [Cellulomonas bogoriensis]KGM14081.1 allophanate hydrolase [Cellulomonas bogoriensis 69B4 = DSM 16987]